MSDGGIDSEDLRRRFLEPPAGARAGEDCPPPERILDAVLGRLSVTDNREIADHGALCPSCTVAWRLAREYANEAGLAVGSVSDSVQRRPGGIRARYWLPAAAALAAVLAVIAIWLPLPPVEQSAPTLRAPAREEIRSLIAEDLPLSVDSFTLRWSPMPEGARYDVRVTDRALGHLAGAQSLVETEFTVPASALAVLEPGSLVLWQVEATLPDGRRLVSSTFAARLE